MLRILPLLLLFLLAAIAPRAEETARTSLAPLDLSTPRAAYLSYLESSRDTERAYEAYLADKSSAGAAAVFDGVARSMRVLDLGEVPAAQRTEVGGDAVIDLFDILMRLPPLDPAAIPGGAGADLPASWTIPGTEIEMARAETGPRAGEYLFTPETVARMPEFHARVIGMPPVGDTLFPDWSYQLMAFTGPAIPDALVHALPDPLKAPLLGTLVWKAVLTVAIWFAVVALTAGWGVYSGRIAARLGPVPALVLRMSVPALLAALVWGAHRFAVHQSSLAGLFAQGEAIATTLALYAALAWLSFLACHLVVELVVALPAIPDQSYDAHLLRLVARVGGLLAAGAVLVIGADRVGIPALGLIAGVGVGGVALALAAQSTVENLFGGVSIFVDRPFRIGDSIDYGSGSGVVETIGPRSSRLRGPDGTLTTVPNGDLAKLHIVNSSMRNKCLFSHTLALRCETTRLQIEWLLATMRRRLAAHPMVEQGGDMPRVRLVAFGQSSIDIEVRANILTRDYGAFLEIQEELLLDLQDIVEEGGSGLAGRGGPLDPEGKARAEQSALAARGKREIGVPAAG